MLTSWRAFAAAHPACHTPTPTVEHFTPLLITLGVVRRPEAPVDPLIDGFWMGLAKRSFQVS